MNKKDHQPALTVAEQVQNLKDLNLHIESDATAESFLNDVSYFRLIKAYGLDLKPKNGTYADGVSFDQIVALYKFNSKLRQLLFPLIERVEINMRCRIANHFSSAHGILGYKDSSNFSNADYHASFMSDIKEELKRNKNSPFVRNFQRFYNGGDLPFYALIELFSFGMLSKFYKNMKGPDKKAVAQHYGIGYTYLESWVESIAYVRNICAHYGRLYNATLKISPSLYKQYTENGINNQKLFSVILCLRHLLPDDEHWKSFVSSLSEIASYYSVADLSTMGFPKDWMSYLTDGTKT